MLIDGSKNGCLTPEQVPSGEAASFANGKGKKLYIAYQERLKTLNAADFGDLLLENIRLFSSERRCTAEFSEPIQIHSRRSVPGHKRRAVFVAETVRGALGVARPSFRAAAKLWTENPAPRLFLVITGPARSAESR